MRLSFLVFLILLAGDCFYSVDAQEPGSDRQTESDRPELKSLQEEMKSLQKEIDRLRSEMNTAASPPSPRPAPNQGKGAGGAAMNPKLSLDGLFSAVGSSAPDLENIDTGAHDPNQRGFTVQNVEIALSASVDPYFTGNANIVYQLDRNGESFVELEEAYLTTTSLPWNLQIKGGSSSASSAGSTRLTRTPGTSPTSRSSTAASWGPTDSGDPAFSSPIFSPSRSTPRRWSRFRTAPARPASASGIDPMKSSSAGR